VKPANPRILTINGGSSSIKFALFEAGDALRQILDGGIERIGLPEATFVVKGSDQADNFARSVKAPDHTVAVSILMDWIEQRSGRDRIERGRASRGAWRAEVLQTAANYCGNGYRFEAAQSI
jgi:acetate kinase